MISKFKLKTTYVKIPYVVKCDICGREFIVDNPYEDPIDVSGYMATLTYSDNDSPFNKELHCCSTNCLCAAIEDVPYEGKVSFPDVSSSYFARSLGPYKDYNK